MGGSPVAACGQVTALDQSITARDETGGASERLSGLIETNAGIEAGDSGGPLVSAAGRVIGMTTASSGGFFFSEASSQGFAIPSNTATTLAQEIMRGRSSNRVHIGPTAFLGLQVTAYVGFGAPGGPQVVVTGVAAGSPAGRAGLLPGDVIVSVNGQTVQTPTELTSLLQKSAPGDDVAIKWRDTSGRLHAISVIAGTGQPA
jgi:S1-C subfamily serine protease